MLTAVLVVAAAGAALAVAGVVLPQRSHSTRTYVEVLHRVVIRVGSGKVTVVADRQLGAAVADVRRFTARKPTVASHVDNGVLYVTGACPKPTIVTCRIDLRVGVSPEMAVDISTGSGDVRVENTAADVRVRSSAGAIDVVGLTGTADVRTSAGPISGRELAVTRLRASTDAGAVALAFSVAPERVSATTGAGNVDLAVPDEGYRVTTSAPPGRARILVPVDAESPRTIDVRTDAGRVTVRPAPPM